MAPLTILKRSAGWAWAEPSGAWRSASFLFALNATKECLWQYLQQEGLLEDPVELLGDRELLYSLGCFFDRTAYSASMGYESAHKETSADPSTATGQFRLHAGKTA